MSCCLPRAMCAHIPLCFAAVLNRRNTDCPKICYLQRPYAEKGVTGNLGFVRSTHRFATAIYPRSKFSPNSW